MSPDIIRYVRPLNVFWDETTDQHFIADSNLGGATLIFNIDHDSNQLNVRFSVCSQSDNFDKFYGKQVANDQGITLTVPYNENEALVDNLVDYLSNEYSLNKLSYDRRVKTLFKELIDILQFNDSMYEEYQQMVND